MSSRTLAIVLSGMLAVYLLLLGRTGVFLLTSGTAVGALFGLAVLVFPFIGAWVIYRELRFGFTAQKMSELMDVDPDTLVFEDARAEVEADPDRWQAWYRVSVAYEEAGDRRPSRQAMHQAAALFRQEARGERGTQETAIDPKPTGDRTVAANRTAPSREADVPPQESWTD